MHPDLLPTLLKVAAPAFAIVAMLAVSRWRGMSWTRDLALVRPAPRALLAWVPLWIGWMALGELAGAGLGIGPPAPWKPYPLLVVALRVVAIGLLGPAAEEILVRGILFSRIAGTRLGPAGAIVLGAAGWAALHVQYDPATIALIFMDGLFLGLARWRSRSTFVPIILHALGNLVSIGQSLSA